MGADERAAVCDPAQQRLALRQLQLAGGVDEHHHLHFAERFGRERVRHLGLVARVRDLEPTRFYTYVADHAFGGFDGIVTKAGRGGDDDNSIGRHHRQRAEKEKCERRSHRLIVLPPGLEAIQSVGVELSAVSPSARELDVVPDADVIHAPVPRRQDGRHASAGVLIIDDNQSGVKIDTLHDAAYHAAIRVAVVVAVAVRSDISRRRIGIGVVTRPTINTVVAEGIVEGIETDEQSEAEAERIIETIRNEEWIAPAAQPDPIAATIRGDMIDPSASVEPAAAVVSAEWSAASVV